MPDFGQKGQKWGSFGQERDRLCPVDAKGWVEEVWRKGKAILAVNMVNLETAQGIVWGAERAGRPIFLMVSQNAARYGGLEELYAIGKTLKRKARIPVFLHYDHAEGLEDLERAYSLGFDSAMLEAHSAEQLKEARRIAGSRPLEVELEAVEKDGRASSRLPEGELLALAQASQADWWVVDLGTRHKSPHQIRLDLGRLERLRQLGPLVLHGGSSAHPQDLAQAIAKGVAKVNVATAAFLHFTLEVRSRVQEEVDPRKYLGPGREALAQWLASFYLSLP